MILKTPRAKLDLVDLFESIGKHSVRSARRFLTAVEKTLEVLTILPALGTLWESANPEYRGMRFLPVRRFRRYLIFYRAVGNDIEIIRVLRGARDLDTLFQ